MLVTIICMALCASYVYYRFCTRVVQATLPPGPKPLPLVGNVRDLPPKGLPEFRHWLKHRDLYGPISSLTVFGNVLIILHDKRAAHDILSKFAAYSSDRPKLVFASELCGYGSSFFLQNYDEEVRRRRKLLHQHFSTKPSATKFENIRTVEVRRFLLYLFESPENLFTHLKNISGAIMLRTTYGYCIIQGDSDPLVELIDRVVENAARATIPGAWAVDVLPFLKHIPDGFPGSGFKAVARKWKKTIEAAANIPYQFVRQQMKSNINRPSFVSALLAQKEDAGIKVSAADEEDIKWSAATIFLGGIETSSTVLKSFFLAMIMFPDVQSKAQQEIDSVIGVHRLPGPDDLSNLPYVSAAIQEVYRWSPALPMGVPHTMSQDIVYSNYLIPKGAIVLPSSWWYLHDPEIYREPHIFDPERYLIPRCEPDPRSDAFGYGRRACPGRDLAEAVVLLTIAQTLATYKITGGLDGRGFERKPSLEIKAGIIAPPLDFSYQITPRSAKHVELIQQIQTDKKEESDAEHLDIEAIQNCIS